MGHQHFDGLGRLLLHGQGEEPGEAPAESVAEPVPVGGGNRRAGGESGGDGALKESGAGGGGRPDGDVLDVGVKSPLELQREESVESVTGAGEHGESPRAGLLSDDEHELEWEWGVGECVFSDG